MVATAIVTFSSLGGLKPSSNYTGGETSTNLNSSNAKSVTVKAKWTAICVSGIAPETINLNTNESKILSYTGASICLLFAKEGNYKFELWGASGGDSSKNTGGKGGYVSGDIYLNNSSTLYAFIGSMADNSSGGYNGGGIGYDAPNHEFGGGGATDIRVTAGDENDATSLRSRVLVAGGGGGAATYTITPGGSAGGLTGINGYCEGNGPCTGGTNNSAYSPKGGTQISGGAAGSIGCPGSPGAFGRGGDYTPSSRGGGGGSGWYGGAGGGYNCSNDVMSGAGGSSYISGHTGSVAVTSTSSSSPKSGCTTGTTNNACSITPYINPATNASYTFTNTVMIDGAGYKWTNTKGALTTMPNPSGGNYASGVGHSGNGYARITWLGDTI